jgi:hypothetical protein
MKKLFLIFIVIALTGCAPKCDPRIIGTFVSDKAETLAYLEGSGAYTEKQIDVFSGLLGKLKVTCDGENVTWSMEGWTGSEPLRIIEQTDEYIVKESDFFGGTIRSKTIFTQDGYWVVGGIAGPNYREKFVRVGQP